MVEVPRPPIEICDKAPTDLRQVPLREIILQHRTRYRVRTTLGDMIFKHIGRLEKDQIYSALASMCPEYEPMRLEFSELFEKSRYENGLTGEEMKRMHELDKLLEPFTYEYCLPCIVYPKFASVEELEAFLTMLPKAESDVALDMLGRMQTDSGVALSPEGVLLIQELKIPLPADLTIETITAEQAQAFIEGAKELGEQAMAVIKGAMKSNAP